MRLDFYGKLDNWQDGLVHHARWLKGSRFSRESLEREKPLVNAECDVTAKRLATHKFAFAAWAQGFRHGRTLAAVKGDVSSATLAQIQQHHDKHLTVLKKVVVCVVGGLSADSARPALTKQLGKITSEATGPQMAKLAPGKHQMTWDLDARHLLVSWPIPRFTDKRFPPLMVAAPLLSMRFMADPDLKALTGMVLAGADLTTPEGTFLYVSASLRPEASFDTVHRRIDGHVQALRSGDIEGALVTMIAQQYARRLSAFTDPSSVKDQAPKNVSVAMLEGNLGLQWGTQEFRYGDDRYALAGSLRKVDAEDVQVAAGTYLSTEKQSYCTLVPR